MIAAIVCAPAQRASLARVLTRLGAHVRVTSSAQSSPVRVSLTNWQSPELDLLRLDSEIHERETVDQDLCLDLSSESDAPTFYEQLLTRYQRLLPFVQRTDPVVARVLPRNRALFDLTKPLVRADYAHALDTWRWTLRLDFGASSALQLAALFHDIERLRGEPDARVEHLAPDYSAFKQAHARSGALLSAEILSQCDVAPELVARVQQLVERHETPGEDAELAALNDADALSFFSLNSWGFVEYFGLAHSRAKVAYTLGRMRPAAKRYLDRFRYHPRMWRLLREQLDVRPKTATTFDAPLQPEAKP
jgi:hypothetical protein